MIQQLLTSSSWLAEGDHLVEYLSLAVDISSSATLLISLLSASACVLLAVRLFAFRELIGGWTVTYSWKWSLIAVMGVLCNCSVCLPGLPMNDGWRDAIQYFAAVLLLAPPVCTLGARSPGVAAWQWFVVLPMILVLAWPAASELLSSRGLERMILGAPALIGIVLVMTMSLGTGLGTTMSVPALLYGAAIVCCIAPVTGWCETGSLIPCAASWLLVLTERLACRDLTTRKARLVESKSAGDAIDNAWLFFQSLYGLPWTRRFQDRVNQFAGRERWDVRLTMEGFRTSDGRTGSPADVQKPLEAFAWALQRFASNEWIDLHLLRFANPQTENRSNGTAKQT